MLLSRAGSIGAAWPLLLGTIATFGKEAPLRLVLAGLLALAIGFASSELLKDLTPFPRPFAVLTEVRLLVAAPLSCAFSSGHATSAFAVTTGVLFSTKRLMEQNASL